MYLVKIILFQPITDKDIDMILNPSKSDDNNSQNSTKKSSSLDSDSCDTNVASFGGTLELMDESDSDDDDEAVVYDVNNLPASKNRSKEDEKNADEFLNKFINENGGNTQDTPLSRKRSRSPVKSRDINKEPPRKRQKISNSPTNSKRSKQKYISAAISLDVTTNDDDFPLSLDLSDSEDSSEDLLQFCVGDVTKPIGNGNRVVAW